MKYPITLMNHDECEIREEISLSLENADKIALNTLVDLVDDMDIIYNLEFNLVNKIKGHHSLYTAMDVLSYYIKTKIINPIYIFQRTDDEYWALMIWKASEYTEFYYDDFMNCWDEENPIPGWKGDILSTSQNDIEINRRQDLLKIIPLSER